MIDKESGRAAVVDPGDAARVLLQFEEVQAQWDAVPGNASSGSEGLNEGSTTTSSSRVAGGGSGSSWRGGSNQLISSVKSRPELTTALITHYHYDHAGGNKLLHVRIPELRIVGSQKEAVPYANAVAAGGAKLWLGRTEIDVIQGAGHTRGHVMYYIHGPTSKRSATLVPEDGSAASESTTQGGRAFTGSGALFSGDMIFVGGVGKFFEGTAEDVYPVLYSQLRHLPPETPLFCGHEYTVNNLKFALWLDRGNKAVEEKVSRVRLQALCSHIHAKWLKCAMRCHCVFPGTVASNSDQVVSSYDFRSDGAPATQPRPAAHSNAHPLCFASHTHSLHQHL